MSATAIAPPQVRWDLTSLFSGLDDPRLATVWSDLGVQADDFGAKYRGQVSSLSPLALAEALGVYANISANASKPINYASLVYSCQSNDAAVGAFLAQQMEEASELSVKLLFFELELQDLLPAKADHLASDPALGEYQHYLGLVRLFSPHKLSEPQEIILEETANTGCRAWVRFYEEMLASHVFRILKPGDTQETEQSEPETMAQLREPDRALRKAAGDSLTLGMSELERSFCFAYNTLLQDKRVGDRLRSHPYAEHSRHLANELQKETVDLVVEMCRANYGLVERFYHRKRPLLGLDELTHIDRYAPLFESKAKKSWDEGREMVVEAFSAFHPELGSKADEFFTQNWIDAEPRTGKQGGAFCSYNTPDTHPVVFMNYLCKLDDVMTLAHELGHGAHASFSRQQNYFNFQGTLPLAELASTFGEMLVFEKIVAGASDRDKTALYAEKIESIFATVFRQAALFSFEVRAHNSRREEGEVSAEQFGDIWQEELQKMFGSSITLGEQHRKWWMMIGHFFFAPFYVYAYSFGELLALSLYQAAKRGGEAFADRYIELLKKGGSETPEQLMAFVGVDLNSREFWQGGFDAIEGFVAEFERLSSSL